MKLPSHQNPGAAPGSVRSQRSGKAFTLTEVCVATVVAAITVAGLIQGHIQSQERADWSGTSLAAQAMAVQRMEQTRAARWDAEAGVDEVIASNFPTQALPLDLPMSGTNIVYGTNTTTITTISATDPMLKMIRVDCVWRWNRKNKLMTNTVATYRSPDNS